MQAKKRGKPSAYAEAGVDIDVMMRALQRARKNVESTFTAGVRGGLGSFGGLFDAPGRDQVLVSSIDGVGTKLNVAVLAGRHDTVGQDLVNHCVNDILVQGARPLFFMDYIGAAHLQPDVFASLLHGLCKACRANGCALLGGETAEMPGLYPVGEYDLVGCIVGTVPRARLITGKTIRPGDALIGLPSSGLHTNGYSLARKIVFERAKLGVNDAWPGTRRTVGQVLLAVHRSYLAPVAALWDRVRIQGMAHITGGGLVDNVPRMLPQGCDAVLDPSAWKIPSLFRFLEETGEVERAEMVRVFNMGIGLVLAVRRRAAAEALRRLREAGEKRAAVIGRVAEGSGRVRFEQAS